MWCTQPFEDWRRQKTERSPRVPLEKKASSPSAPLPRGACDVNAVPGAQEEGEARQRQMGPSDRPSRGGLQSEYACHQSKPHPKSPDHKSNHIKSHIQFHVRSHEIKRRITNQSTAKLRHISASITHPIIRQRTHQITCQFTHRIIQRITCKITRRIHTWTHCLL